MDTKECNGARLDARDLSYATVNGTGKMRRILQNISFDLGSGSLCAVMGPSGAGKSTLLDLLAARKLVGTWSGTIRVDGKPRSKYFHRETAYVLQDCILIPTLTTEETIRYAAMTMLPEGTSKGDLQKRVELVMEMLKLTHVRDSRVGDAMTKGLSGGQAKRLSIAVEIVSLPRLVFLDEPTSLLDSATAYEVMTAIREMVTESSTCMCTIHQPSKEIFALFSHLLLVSSGRLIYFGPVAEALVYFTGPELGYTFEDEFHNPAEFVIEVSCGQRLAAGLCVPRQPEELEALFKSSRLYHPLPLSPRALAAEEYSAPFGDSWSLYGSDRYVTSQWTQFAMLMERTWIARIRDTSELRVQLLKNVAVALLVGLVFWQAGTISTPFFQDGRITSEASSVNSFLFFFVIISMLSNAQTIPYLCGRTPLYHRELASNAYAPLPYWLSSFLTLIPMQLVFHLLVCVLVYPIVGLNANPGVATYFVFATYLGNVITAAAAMALTAAIPTESLAITLFSVQFLFLSMFSCYVIKYDDIPAYWKWATYICYPKWIYEAVMVNEWRQFDTDDTGSATGSGGVLSYYSFDNFALGDVVWIALLFTALFLGVAYYHLLPPKGRLVKVRNATDVVTMLSQTGTSVSASSISSVRAGERLVGATRAKKGYSGDLKTSLLSEGGTLEASQVASDPPLVHHQPLSVDFYKVSTGIIDPSRGCRLVFHDVDYTVPVGARGEPKTLLRGITGRAMPGEMVALMGASGAGKSTLLDLLAQRKTRGKVTGAITYTGSSTMPASAYVMQSDVHVGVLTVRESIYFAAELRLPEQMSQKDKAKRVEKIIDMLGLQKVADSMLSTETVRGISGGELKRVSIAVEIVHLPGLMFLDEPTTGLDSAIALEVMCAVRNLANQNRTVICTIHQPSEDTFALFDTVLLLAAGCVVYMGPRLAAVEFFVQSPYQFKFNVGTNPADFIIAAAGSFLQAIDGRSVSSGELAAHYLTSERAQYAAVVLPSTSDDSLSSQSTAHDASESGFAAAAALTPLPSTAWHQLKTLMRRRVLAMSKEPKQLLAPLIGDLVIGFLLGSLFYQLGTGEGCDESCYTDRTSLLYFCVLLLVMGRMTLVAGLFHDRLVYYRERGSGLYHSLPYCLSVLVPRMPITVLNVLCLSLCMYPMSGLRSDHAHYGVFFVVMLLNGFCGLFMAYFIVAISSSSTVALSYFPVFVVFNMFYAGNVVHFPVMPDWQSSWLPYISIFRYSFQGLVLNEFQHNGDLPESHAYINELGFDVISVQGCCGVLLMCIAGLMTAFYLAITYIDFEER